MVIFRHVRGNLIEEMQTFKTFENMDDFKAYIKDWITKINARRSFDLDSLQVEYLFKDKRLETTEDLVSIYDKKAKKPCVIGYISRGLPINEMRKNFYKWKRGLK